MKATSSAFEDRRVWEAEGEDRGGRPGRAEQRPGAGGAFGKGTPEV